jgi:hypothetical protein
VANLLTTFALLFVGLVLTFTGFFVYRAGLKLFGFLLGAGLGFFATSALGLTGIPQVALLLVLGVGGLWLARKVYLVMIVVPGAVTGFGLALWWTGTSLDPITNLLNLSVLPTLLGGLVIGAVAAFVLQKVVVVFVSAAWGAYLTWAALETDAVVQALANLTVPTPPTWTNVMIAVGVLAQVGIWYVTKRYDDDELTAKVMGLLGFGGDDGAESDPQQGA